MIEPIAALTVRPVRGRTVMESVAALAAIALVAAPAVVREAAAPLNLRPDAHATASIDIAINRAVCGQVSALSPVYDVGADLYAHADLIDRPIRDLLAARAGSVDAYCRSATQPFLNNENSLMLVERAVLAIDGNASAGAIGRALLAVRVGLLLVFVFAMLFVGAPPLLAGVLFALALAIGSALDAYRLSVYPLILPMVLAQVGLGAIALRRRPRSIAGLAAVFAAAGAIAACATNLRTDIAPLSLVAWTMWLAYAVRGGLHDGGHRRGVALASAAFAIAWLLLSTVIVRPLATTGARGLTYHTIAHPLVLSLAIPSNAFAASQGIEWDDARGEPLAHQVDPDARYLRPGFDTALFQVYWGLWTSHPKEMLRVYVRKLAVSGSSMMASARLPLAGLPFWRLILFPVVHITNGAVLLAVFAASLVWAGRHALRSGSELAALASIVAAMGLLTQLEMVLTVSMFFLQYHSVAIFAIAFVCLGAYALALDRIATESSRRAIDADVRVGAILAAGVATVYVVASMLAAFRSTGSAMVDAASVQSAVLFAVLMATMYAASRAIAAPLASGIAALGSVVVAAGRWAVVDLAAGVLTLLLLVLVWRTLDRTSDRSRIAAAIGIAAGLAIACGVEVIVVSALVLGAVAISPAWRLGMDVGFKQGAATIAVAVLVAWIGGAAQSARMTPWPSFGAQLARQVRAVATGHVSTDADAQGSPVKRARGLAIRALTVVSAYLAPVVILRARPRHSRLAAWLIVAWAVALIAGPATQATQAAAAIGVASVSAIALLAVASAMSERSASRVRSCC